MNTDLIQIILLKLHVIGTRLESKSYESLVTQE